MPSAFLVRGIVGGHALFGAERRLNEIVACWLLRLHGITEPRIPLDAAIVEGVRRGEVREGYAFGLPYQFRAGRLYPSDAGLLRVLAVREQVRSQLNWEDARRAGHESKTQLCLSLDRMREALAAAEDRAAKSERVLFLRFLRIGDLPPEYEREPAPRPAPEPGPESGLATGGDP